MEGPPPGPRAPQKMDVQLEGLALYQEGAVGLKAGEPLAVRAADGSRLECVTQTGVAVGLIPADKRGVLSRGPWAGTVRSVKRRSCSARAAAAPSDAAPMDVSGGAAAAPPAARGSEAAASQQPAAVGAQEEGAAASTDPASAEPQQAQQEQQGGAAAAEPADASQQQAEPAGAGQETAAAAVVQVLVRFVPEEQRWERRGEGSGGAAAGGDEDWGTTRLSREQFEALGECAWGSGAGTGTVTRGVQLGARLLQNACRQQVAWHLTACRCSRLSPHTLRPPVGPPDHLAGASEEVRWMLRDERLQKVIAEVDAAPDRERVRVRGPGQARGRRCKPCRCC